MVEQGVAQALLPFSLDTVLPQLECVLTIRLDCELPGCPPLAFIMPKGCVSLWVFMYPFSNRLSVRFVMLWQARGLTVTHLISVRDLGPFV